MTHHRFTLNIALLLALATLLSSTLLLDTTEAQTSYTCVTPHCYGVNRLGSGAPFLGATTQIQVVSMTPSIFGQGFLTNELWLGQRGVDTPPYPSNPGGSCWVEAGYRNQGAQQNYFWAEFGSSGALTRHDLATVPSSDYNQYTYFSIIQLWPPTSWFVEVISNNYQHGEYTTQSIGMTPYSIDIGQEYLGQAGDGVAAPAASFVNNEFYDANGVRRYRTDDGLRLGPWSTPPIPTDPPFAGWHTPPSTSSTGGVWFTYCCAQQP